MLAALEQLVYDHTANEVKSFAFDLKANESFVVNNMSSAIYTALKNQVTKWNIALLVNLFGEVSVNEKHILIKEAKSIFLSKVLNTGFNIKILGDSASHLFPIILNKVIKDISVNDQVDLDIKDVLLELGGDYKGEFDLNFLADIFNRNNTSFALQCV